MTVPDRPRRWRKSSHSETNNCVEVAKDPDGVAVRDSKDPEGGVIELPGSGWRGLAARVRQRD
ncbi:DUF397 domain-containing protein [Amycolatopsis sp. cmx-4-83]|uniref:DUF397 domain-containing protein n=1 Tax=Amycolatopsis sp. cmx-4-83 TaxID=2790940 RepID=UPI00397D1353